MNTYTSKTIVPGIVAAAALALAASAVAQTPAPAAPPPATTSSPTAPRTGHHMGRSTNARHQADMKKECEAMMARHKEMQDDLKARDATLDRLVAEMNAATESKAVDAMEKPMAAVINELVAERKASRAMMMEMQPEMMAHMAHHMEMHGTRGAMDCPMMKTRDVSGPKADEQKPKM